MEAQGAAPIRAEKGKGKLGELARTIMSSRQGIVGGDLAGNN